MNFLLFFRSKKRLFPIKYKHYKKEKAASLCEQKAKKICMIKSIWFVLFYGPQLSVSSFLDQGKDL